MIQNELKFIKTWAYQAKTGKKFYLFEFLILMMRKSKLVSVRNVSFLLNLPELYSGNKLI